MENLNDNTMKLVELIELIKSSATKALEEEDSSQIEELYELCGEFRILRDKCR